MYPMYPAPSSGGSGASYSVHGQTAAAVVAGDEIGGANSAGEERKFIAEEVAALANAGGGYITGRYYVPFGFSLSSGTVGPSLGTISFYVFYCSKKTTFTRIGTQVTTGATGASFYLGVYKWGNAKASSKIFDSGPLSAETAGNIESTISLTLNPGIYGLAFLTNSTFTVRRMEQTATINAQNVGFDATTNPSAPGYTLESASTLPTTPGTGLNIGFTYPLVYLRVV